MRLSGGTLVIAAAVALASAARASELKDASRAYSAGRYAEAETLARRVLAGRADPTDAAITRERVAALSIVAYSEARRKRYETARAGFAEMASIAAELPGGGVRSRPGDPEIEPTFEEEAVFQQVVCTSALGDRKGAEAGYRAFLKTHPQSVLIHAAVKRLARIHGGDVPKDAEALWKTDMRTQQARYHRAALEDAMCGPECLAEILRRRGLPHDAHALAEEMKLSPIGASLADLAKAAGAHGLKARGLQLTDRGLDRAALPLITLVAPGHFVIVEAVHTDRVVVWQQHGARRTYPGAEWRAIWSGRALEIR